MTISRNPLLLVLAAALLLAPGAGAAFPRDVPVTVNVVPGAHAHPWRFRAPNDPSAQGTHAAVQDTVDTSHGDEMVRAYFAEQVRQIQEGWLSSVSDLGDWEAQRADRRQELLRMLGLDPLPARTDLNVSITGRLEHEDFFVEKLHFQSMPGLYVTANLYVPKEREGPLPGVLYVCGHANRMDENGLSLGSKTAYQRHAAWYARHGYVALIIDTIQLAEIEGVHHGTYRYDRWWWWNRGYTPAGVETWNGIRALDYLASRPEVDAERLAVTGRSGGGIYSWFITAVDDRVTTSVPTAGITDLANYVVDDVVTGHCDCMFMVNSRRWDFSMVTALAAPRPVLLANGNVDPIFPLDGVLRICDQTRDIYELYGAADRFAKLIVEAAHDDTPPLQQATYAWMHRHLHGRELLDDVPAEPLFDPVDLRVFDELPEDEINTRIDELFVRAAPVPDVPGSRSAWERVRAGWLDGLREETFGGWPSTDEPLSAGQVGTLEPGDVRITAIDFDSQALVRLRMWVLEHRESENPAQPETASGAESMVVSVLDDSSWQVWLSIIQAAAATPDVAAALLGPGAYATRWPEPDVARLGALVERLRENGTVLAVVAPRGVGPTTWTETERGHGIRRNFMLVGQTVEGMQVWDVRRAVQVLRSDPAWGDVALTVEGRGTMAGVALYAGLFEPGISSLDLYDLPDSHRDGPILLNVRRVVDMPQAVAAALESVEVVNVLEPAEVVSQVVGIPDERAGEARALRESWAWPRQLAQQGHASGALRLGVGSPWIVGPEPARP